MKATRIPPTGSTCWPGPGELTGMAAACYARILGEEEAAWKAEDEAAMERIRVGHVKRVEKLRNGQLKHRETKR